VRAECRERRKGGQPEAHKVRLTTGGSCIGNPGPGGWACLLRCVGHERVLSGGEAATTNNRMELVAVIRGLRALNQPCEVEIVTDSQYVQRGMSEWNGGGLPIGKRRMATRWQTGSFGKSSYRWHRITRRTGAGSEVTAATRTSSGVMRSRGKQPDRLSVMDERQAASSLYIAIGRSLHPWSSA
jgi:ribonuclease HI